MCTQLKSRTKKKKNQTKNQTTRFLHNCEFSSHNIAVLPFWEDQLTFKHRYRKICGPTLSHSKMPACLAAQITLLECAQPAHQCHSTSPPHNGFSNILLHSAEVDTALNQQRRVGDKTNWLVSLTAHTFLRFLDLTHWCKQLQHATVVAHHLHHVLQWWGHCISNTQVTVFHRRVWPRPCSVAWLDRSADDLNNWLSSLKVDQHYPSFVHSQRALPSVALALGWLSSSDWLFKILCILFKLQSLYIKI